jgi:small GTP-binding protein
MASSTAAVRSASTSSTGGAASALASKRIAIEGKVIVIGSVSVGKTCLISRLTRPTSDTKSVRPSVGVSFFQHTLEGKTASLHASVWDTAGQERFRAVSSLYYRQSAAAVLVFDMTSRQSFDDLPFFLSSVKQACGTEHLLLLVVANKSDMPASAREVSSAEGSMFAESMGALYHETSAQTGEGVAEAFALLADAAPKYLELQEEEQGEQGSRPSRSAMAAHFRKVAGSRRPGARPALVVSGDDEPGTKASSCC